MIIYANAFFDQHKQQWKKETMWPFECHTGEKAGQLIGTAKLVSHHSPSRKVTRRESVCLFISPKEAGKHNVYLYVILDSVNVESRSYFRHLML